MGETAKTFGVKQKTTLSNGSKLIADEGIELTSEIRATCAQVATAMTQTFKRGVYAVYLNEDREKLGMPHSVTVKFDTMNDE